MLKHKYRLLLLACFFGNALAQYNNQDDDHVKYGNNDKSDAGYAANDKPDGAYGSNEKPQDEYDHDDKDHHDHTGGHIVMPFDSFDEYMNRGVHFFQSLGYTKEHCEAVPYNVKKGNPLKEVCKDRRPGESNGNWLT